MVEMNVASKHNKSMTPLGICNMLTCPTPVSCPTTPELPVEQSMTSTDRLVAGVIGALFAPPARLYEMNAAFGAVIVCVALAATMEVIMATTVAMRRTPGRENFWIRIVIAFILFGFLCVGFPMCCLRVLTR